MVNSENRQIFRFFIANGEKISLFYCRWKNKTWEAWFENVS